MAWWLAGDQYPRRSGASIHCLVLLAWRDFESFSSLKNKVMMFHFEGQFSFQHEEELTRAGV
jgi:hypothetical protein